MTSERQSEMVWCPQTPVNIFIWFYALQKPPVTQKLCPDDSNNSPMESCGWKKLWEVTESVPRLQKGISVLLMGKQRQGVTSTARSVTPPPPTPSQPRSWNRVLGSRAPTALWVSMWEIYSYCSSLQRKLLLTVFSSCKTFGWPWGRVSAGEVKRSHHNAPSPKAAAGGGMRTAAGAWGWAGAGCQLLLIAGVTLLPIIYFVRMRLH